MFQHLTIEFSPKKYHSYQVPLLLIREIFQIYKKILSDVILTHRSGDFRLNKVRS